VPAEAIEHPAAPLCRDAQPVQDDVLILLIGDAESSL